MLSTPRGVDNPNKACSTKQLNSYNLSVKTRSEKSTFHTYLKQIKECIPEVNNHHNSEFINSDHNE